MGQSVLTNVPPAARAAVFDYRNDALHCEGVPAERLVAQYGTPLYVYSRAGIEAGYREVKNAFAEADPLIAYSVKANGNLSVLRLLTALGAGADIVSGGELFRALRARVPATRILFSGVGKTVVEMAAAVEVGIYGFNVESEGELRALSSLGSTMRKRANIALRVNPAIDPATPHAYTRTGHKESKFGIPYEDAMRLYRLAAKLPWIKVKGVDVHIGSQIVDPEPYRQALEQVMALIDELNDEDMNLRYVDIGGGFGINYEDPDHNLESASMPEFAAQLVPLLRDRKLRLVLEPGRYLVGPAGMLLTRVLYVKRMGSRTYVITDAGMNDLIRPSHYASYHGVQPARRHTDREHVKVDVVGPICESGDFLALDRSMAMPEAGELLAVRTAGAYGFAMSSTYNARPRPAEAMVDGEDDWLIRRRETYDDLVRGEIEALHALEDRL
ncbi:MAG TPA: diaminopimelate decarboxylase [Longimicrobiales bacterium]|nr:diaminopimelate decarboxylase [Longimicrobiales bacterium]